LKRRLKPLFQLFAITRKSDAIAKRQDASVAMVTFLAYQKAHTSMANPKTEILYGLHPVREALRANRRRIHALWVREGRQDVRIASIRQLADGQGVAVQTVDEQRLTALAGHAGHQGVCARVAPLSYYDLSDIAEHRDSCSGIPFVVLLDNLQDPQNLGAIIRTAFCAGADGIVIPQDRSAASRPSVSKTSAGALEHMPIARVPNLVNAIMQLKKNGLWIVGLEGAADQSLFDCDLKIPLGLIIGGEEKGLRPLVKRHCDFLVSIPHARAFNSLNASVAAALAIFETYRQRSQTAVTS
jgi:23S rRNA (guanosine2251-2'-O)-methyltransferase